MASTDESVQAGAPAKPSGASAQYDNFAKMAPFMDIHLLFPFLGFLETLGIYKTQDIASARLELAKRTKMSDYAVECYKGLHGEDAPCPPGARIGGLGGWSAASLIAVIDNDCFPLHLIRSAHCCAVSNFITQFLSRLLSQTSKS